MGCKERMSREELNIESRRCWKHPATGYIYEGDVSMDTLPPYVQEGKPYTIYALIDPRDYTVRYIGITDDVYQRFKEHLRCDGYNPGKDAWIEELKQANVMLIMKTLEVVETVDQARERETHWIHYHRFLGIPLFNLVIPTIRIPSTPRTRKPRSKPTTPGKPLGRKYDNEGIRQLVLHRYRHSAWPEDMSRDMKQDYEFFYFKHPKKAEASNPQKYARHQRAWARSRQWIEEYEERKSMGLEL